MVSMKSTPTKSASSTEPASTYVPCPWMTFVVDKSVQVCVLCSADMELRLGTPGEEATDHTPALFPCGHVFGSACIDRWIEVSGGKASCPVCRWSASYSKCGHKVLPKKLDMVNIFDCPRTLPDGGYIPARCLECRWEDACWETRMATGPDRSTYDYFLALPDRGVPPVIAGRGVQWKKHKMERVMRSMFTPEMRHGW